MRLPFPRRVETVSLNAYQWFRDTPYRALDEAYRAAITIQKIETEYFNGNKIEADSAHNRSVAAYFQTKLHQLLRTARWRLAEFRIASAIVSDSDNSLGANNTISNGALAIATSPEPRTDYDAQQTLTKLTIVDQVLSRYAEPEASAIELESTQAMPTTTNLLKKNGEISTNSATKTDSIFSKSGVLPRSILKTGQRINRELKPNTEAEVLREFQLSRYRTRKSVQFLALLIILPLLTQQISKNLIFAPILNHCHPAKLAGFLFASILLPVDDRLIHQSRVKSHSPHQSRMIEYRVVKGLND